MSNPQKTSHQKIETVFQEGILDRIGSRVGKVKTVAGNLGRGAKAGIKAGVTGREQNVRRDVVEAEQVKNYLTKKYNEIANDLDKLLKSSSNKTALEQEFNNTLREAFNDFISKSNKIFSTESTPPPIPDQEEAPQQTAQQRLGPAPTNMGSNR